MSGSCRSGDRRSGFCRGLNRGAVAFLPFFVIRLTRGRMTKKVGFSEKVILSDIRRKDVEYFFENKLFGPIRRSALRLLQRSQSGRGCIFTSFRHSPDTGANDEKSGFILPLPRVVPLRGPTLG